MTIDEKFECYVSNNPEHLVWIRLKRLENEKLCQKLLSEQEKDLTQDIINKKAIGLSSAVKCSLGFWNQENCKLNNWILSRYYALLQMTIAEQVASCYNQKGLSEIQSSTKHGHGLKSYWNDEKDINNFMVYINNSGYFSTYLEFLGIDSNQLKIQVNIKKQEDYEANKDKIVSIFDLFRRIPELSDFIKEYISMPSLAFFIGHSFENSLKAEKRMNADPDKFKNGFKGLGSYQIKGETYIDIYNSDYSKEDLEKLVPFSDLEYRAKESNHSAHYVGKFVHESEYCWQELKTHKSSYCGTHYIVPVFGCIQEIIPIHFMILYTLSIIVRYYPDLWHEIEEGKYSHLYSLLEHYLTIFDNTVPLIMLQRISHIKIATVLPGSLNSPI